VAHDIRFVVRARGVRFSEPLAESPPSFRCTRGLNFVINRCSGIVGTCPLFRWARRSVSQRWAFWVLLMPLCAIMAKEAAGQAAHQQRGRKAGTLGQNFPNPFSAETTIPFTVGDDPCGFGSEHHSVTLKIYNVLAQVVAIPALRDSAAIDSAAAPQEERPLENVSLGCGSFQAFWNGKVMRTGQDAPPGVYVYQLIVDGKPVAVRKMLVAR
jgi:hypothetical protein